MTLRPSSRLPLHPFKKSLAMCVVVLAFGGAWNAACGAWPRLPDSPMVLGGVNGISAFNEHVLATTPDGAAWHAWIDGECMGTLRVQRISAGGTLLAPDGLHMVVDEGCTSLAPRLAACADGSILVSAVDGSLNGGGGLLIDSRIQRLDANGKPTWGEGLVLPGVSGKVGQLLGLPGGDALIAWHKDSTIFVARYSMQAAAMWSRPASIAVLTGPSMRIFGLVPDGADGAFVLWDVPSTYTRSIWAARITATGASAWAQPMQVVPPTPGSSRHTGPVAIANGVGEMLLAWTQGAESASTPVPIRIQRIASDGSILLEPEGRRISLANTRQYEVDVSRDAESGDAYFAWRDGGFEAQSLRAQRMTPESERAWGDAGVFVAPVGVGFVSHFDGQWNAGRLAIAVADAPAESGAATVQVHRVEATGAVEAGAWPVSGTTPAGVLRIAAIGAASVVAWNADAPGFADSVVAQRLNSDGTLGLRPGDATGDGQANVNDLLTVITGWGPCATPLATCTGDIAPSPDGDGQINVNDLLMVITNWG